MKYGYKADGSISSKNKTVLDDDETEIEYEGEIVDLELFHVVDGKVKAKTASAIAALSQERFLKTILADYTVFMENWYQEVVSQKGWTNKTTCIGRAGYPGPFQSQAIAFGTWMDTCNALAYKIAADVQAGKIPLPTKEEMKKMMPVMQWPN